MADSEPVTGRTGTFCSPAPAQAVAVVGGGVLGMYLAFRLRSQGASVTLFEAAPRTGGLASPDRIGGYTWDRFYHVILMSDLNTRRLIEDLGLEDRLRWGTTKTGFFVDGQLYSMSNSLEFLRFPPLSLFDKLRLGATIFFASRIRNWRKLENILAVDWLTRWSGKRVVSRIWLPLLRSKLGANAEKASAAFIWSTIARMYAARRSGIKREMFGYVDGGYEIVLRRLQERLSEIGVETVFDARVEKVVNGAGGASVYWGGEQQREFDAVVLTVPTPVIAKLCTQLSATEIERLKSVTYQGIACASILLKRSLSQYYVTNITDDWVPFTGVIEMTALVDKATFGGNSLVYLPCYLTQDDDFWLKSDEEIKEIFLDGLDRMYPHFDRRDILGFNLARARNVLAVSTLGYSTRLRPTVKTSLSRVFTVNSAQIANGTLNVNETIGIADANLGELDAHLAGIAISPTRRPGLAE